MQVLYKLLEDICTTFWKGNTDGILLFCYFALIYYTQFLLLDDERTSVKPNTVHVLLLVVRFTLHPL